MSIQRAVYRHTFDAMGSQVEILLVGGSRREAAGAFARSAALADDWEQTFSRFRHDSELSRLNRAGGGQSVSQLLFDGVRTALSAARMTDGLFDPTILPSLLALGYDRPYVEIVAAEREVAANAHGDVTAPRSDWQNIVVDCTSREIVLPDGAQLDLGGIAKGLYADRLAGELASWPGGMVSAGGDLRVWGIPPSGEHWVVGVEHPDDPDHDIAVVELRTGGVSTSGTNRRYWRQGGTAVHHLIDPRSGRPAASGLRLVTAVAATAVEAEVASTTLFVSGRMPEADGWLSSRISLAVAVDADRQLQMLYQRSEGRHNGTRGVTARAA